MNPSSKRRSVAVGILLVLALATGAAYAYWTNSGGGSGSASTDSPVGGGLTVNQNGTLNDMYPGDTAQSIMVDIVNGTGADVHVTDVNVSLPAPGWGGWQDLDGLGGNPACSAGDYTLTDGGPITALDIATAGTASNVDSKWTIKFNNTGSNQDNCKGQALTLTFTAS